MRGWFARHVLTREQEEARLAMYRAGLTDHQMAAALGLTYDAVKSWRQHRGLPAHVAPRRRRFGSPEAQAPTVDAVTQATATTDALTVRRGRRPVEFEPVLSVDVATGRVTVHKHGSWWPTWRGERAS